MKAETLLECAVSSSVAEQSDGGSVRESKTICSACAIRSKCAVRRMLGESADGLEKRVVTMAPNEVVPRETAFNGSGLLTVRRGLVAGGFHIGPDEDIFFSEIVGPGCSTGVQYIMKDALCDDFVIALGRAEICISDKDAIAHACSNSPAAMNELLATIYGQSGRLARLSWVKNAPTVRQKVERLLSDTILWLAPGEPQSEFELDISHSAIASIIEVERHNVSKCLSNMQDEGLVGCGRRRVSFTVDFYTQTEHAKNPWAHNIRKPSLTGDNILL